MKKFVNILLGCFFVLGVSKGTAADLDEVICNAMKGMQVQEEKKIPYNIGDYRLMGISVDCKKKALITEKKHLELALSDFGDDFKTESMRNWKNANCKNMIFNTDTGWSTTQIINDVNENLVLKLEANFRICSQ
jgi:hypothetical protein|tara:strand:- start:31 stop:432 length:402 start_codon:yes stop_codon:yes gene_type:complete